MKLTKPTDSSPVNAKINLRTVILANESDNFVKYGHRLVRSESGISVVLVYVFPEEK